MKTIYLNRKRLMEAGTIVDIKEYHRKYSLEKRNGAYAMVPGTPLVQTKIQKEASYNEKRLISE